jgi:hypothetical protein
VNRKKKLAEVVVYFDVSKAFDSVPYHQLIDCLHHKSCVPPQIIRVIQSNLNGRWFFVKVENAHSSNARLPSGVPQGSVLGPVLFVAYINAITEVPLNPESHVILFADDMALVHPLILDDSVTAIQEDIDHINNGLTNLSLNLNEKKCEFQILKP